MLSRFTSNACYSRWRTICLSAPHQTTFPPSLPISQLYPLLQGMELSSRPPAAIEIFSLGVSGVSASGLSSTHGFRDGLSWPHWVRARNIKSTQSDTENHCWEGHTFRKPRHET